MAVIRRLSLHAVRCVLFNIMYRAERTLRSPYFSFSVSNFLSRYIIYQIKTNQNVPEFNLRLPLNIYNWPSWCYHFSTKYYVLQWSMTIAIDECRYNFIKGLRKVLCRNWVNFIFFLTFHFKIYKVMLIKIFWKLKIDLQRTSIFRFIESFQWT